jgi:hypothetical protein
MLQVLRSGVARCSAQLDRMYMANSGDCRRFAQTCLEMCRVIQDEKSRAALVQMAQVWLRLADEKEVTNRTA